MRREVLSGRNLTFHNRAGCIISNVSLHLYQGEILGIVGINGPGKTILAQLLAGILQPDSGKIVLGEVGQGEQASPELLRAQVGYVGEEPELLENLTVAENLMIGIQAEPWLYASRKRLYQKPKPCWKNTALKQTPRLGSPHLLTPSAKKYSWPGSWLPVPIFWYWMTWPSPFPAQDSGDWLIFCVPSPRQAALSSTPPIAMKIFSPLQTVFSSSAQALW